MFKTIAGILGWLTALALSAGPAAADKSDDTIRMAITDWWSTLDPYQLPLEPQKMVLERFDDYYDKNGPMPAPIGHVIATPMPDRQTQIAEFMTGNLDLIRN